MGLIEAILVGIQFKRLEKPIVFILMLICFLVFLAVGAVIVLVALEAVIDGKGVLPALGMASFSILFFGLTAVCGYFIKRCVR